MKILSLILSRNQLLRIYKTFVRSYLDYGDIIYDKTFNDFFKEKLEKVQYSATLIVTGAIKGTSREPLYKRLYERLVMKLFVIEGGTVNKFSFIKQ